MKVIGLTGGIGAGKSTVSSYLQNKGYRILDADKIAHEITAAGSPVLKEIADLFGNDMIEPDGSLNRKKLAGIVFSDMEKKRMLEAITTKRVVSLISEAVEDLRRQKSCDIIFVDAPLLFESGADSITDMVWMVTADPEVRIARVMERDDVEREDVLRRIANQLNDDEKIEKSQEVIDNSKGKETLYQQVEDLLKKYAEAEV